MSPTTRRAPALLAATLAAIVLAACARTSGEPSPSPTDTMAETDATASPPAAATQPAEGDPTEERMPADTGAVPDAMLAEILADAAARTGLQEAALVVVRADAVTWNDGSLGCPKPGMMYTQALVDGYHVVVAADDRELDYRADRRGTFHLCDSPAPPGPGKPTE